MLVSDTSSVGFQWLDKLINRRLDAVCLKCLCYNQVLLNSEKFWFLVVASLFGCGYVEGFNLGRIFVYHLAMRTQIGEESRSQPNWGDSAYSESWWDSPILQRKLHRKFLECFPGFLMEKGKNLPHSVHISPEQCVLIAMLLSHQPGEILGRFIHLRIHYILRSECDEL